MVIKVEVTAGGFGGIRTSSSLTQNLNEDGQYQSQFELQGWTVKVDGRSFICEYRSRFPRQKAFRRRFALVPGTLELKQQFKTVEASFKRGDLSMMMWREYGITEIRRAEPGGRTFPVNFKSDRGPSKLQAIYCEAPLECARPPYAVWNVLACASDLADDTSVRIAAPTGWAVFKVKLDKTGELCCILYTALDETLLLYSIEDYLRKHHLTRF